MLSKNNRSQKMVATAERQSHFGIRKLTIGTVSVLLGTTLWVGTQTKEVHADTNDEGDQEQKSNAQVVDTENAKKVVVVSKNDSANTAQTKVPHQAQSQTITQPKQKVETQVNKDTQPSNTTSRNTNSNPSKTQAVSSTASVPASSQSKASVSPKTSTTQAAPAANNKQSQPVQKSVETPTSQANTTQSQKANTTLKQDATINTKNLTQTQPVAKTPQISAQSGNLGKTTKKENSQNYNLTQAALKGTNVKLDNLNSELAKLALDAKLVATPDEEVDTNNKNDQTKTKNDYQTVTDWSGVQNAINNDAKGVNIQGTIYANGNLNLGYGQTFTINGVNGASLNLGSGTLTATGNVTFANMNITSLSQNGAVSSSQGTQVTFDNVKSSGASLYIGSGDVHIKGNTTTSVDYGAPHATSSQITNQIGNSWQGINQNNWYNANIVASNVYVDENANLTVNRQVDGDGIVVTAGNNQSQMGHVKVDNNATLTVNLKNGNQPDLRASESQFSIGNANTAIRAYKNGSFTTGVGATVNLNVGHGRGIVFEEPVGGNTTIYGAYNMNNWYNDRTVTRSGNNQNEFKLGDFTNFNLYGRDGVLIGDNAQFVTGEHSILKFRNGGNGVAIDVDAQARVEISPHSVVDLQSNGKDMAGIWNGGNYIGLGENAQMVVDHDATFKYHLTNAWKNGSPNYVDNFNIVSVKNSSHPSITIGNNAVFDGQSDYRNIFGEIVSFSYNDAPTGTAVNIEGAKYVNFQKNSVTTPGAFQNVVPMDPEGKHTGNLFYSWPHNLWNVGGNTYNAYKWMDEDISADTFNDKDFDAFKQSIRDLNNSSSEYWKGVQDLTLAYNMHRSHLEDITPNSQVGVKHGWLAGNSQGYGFDPEFSQRVALIATNIPTEDDVVTNDDHAMKVIVKYDDSLKPGETKVLQKGTPGRTITVTRTYYNVNVSNPDDPIRTVDTSKGDNGHQLITKEVTPSVPEIIAIGPQTATINYVNTKGQPIDDNNQPIVGTATASPVETNQDGDVIFNAHGIPTANTINYNQAPDLAKAEAAGYPTIVSNEWDTKPHKYNIDGLTKDAIIQAAEKGAQLNVPGPTFKVVLKRAVEKHNVTVVFHDTTTNTTIPNVGGNTGDYDPETPLTDTKYTPTDYDNNVKTLEDQGYVPDYPDKQVPPLPIAIPSKNQNIVINMKHGIQPVNPTNPGKPGQPINPNDPNGPKYPDGTTVTDNEITVNHNSNNINVVITYAPDETPTPETGSVTVTYYDDTDNTTIPDVGYQSGTKDVGTPINYNPDPTIKDLENKGYKLVPGQDINIPKDITKGNHDIIIHMVHGMSPVNPDHPNKNVSPSEYEKDVTATVHYEGAGSATPADNVQHAQWTRTVTIDDVTQKVVENGQYTTDWKANKEDYDLVKTPVVQGYYADKAEIPALKVTMENLRNVVTYAPNGKIIPVDKDGNPIPDAPTPHFPTNPDNPTTTTDGKVPNVPDYKPESGQPGDPVKPGNNPGDDVKVPYVKTPDVITAEGKVTYYDETAKKVLSTVDLKGNVGEKISYTTTATITNYENQGYQFVNSDFKNGEETFSRDASANNFRVNFVHGTQTVTPDKPGEPGQPINPNDPNGPKWPDDTDKDSLDKAGKQTIHYEGAGEKTPKDNVETTNFTRTKTVDKVTGDVISETDWTPKEHDFNVVKTPVVEGYHANEAEAGGFKSTPNDPTKTYTVTYSPNGKIIPVTPDGTPIPNVPNPPYITNPTNPTGVTPNEPVPTIPAYTPDKSTITPENPGKDTPVIYHKNETPTPETGSVTVTYHDDTTNTTIPGVGYQSGTKDVNTPVDYNPDPTIKDLENKGYKLVPGQDINVPKEITKGAHDIVIHMVHGTTTVTPNKPGEPGQPINPNDPNGPKWPNNTGKNSLEKDGKQTIHYEGAGNETPKDNVQTTSFTRTATVDNVTGKVISTTDWTPNEHTFGTVKTPVIKGYHANKAEAGGFKATPNDPTKTYNVTYSPNGKIVPVTPDGTPIPNVPNPPYTTNPDNPTGVTPNEPVPTIPGYTPEKNTITPEDPGKDTPVVYHKNETPTPETGSVTVTYHDDTTNSTIPGVGYESGTKDVNTPVDYNPDPTIKDLENKGYKLVPGQDINVPKEITKGAHDITIHMVHGTTTVTPDKPGEPGQPINPNDPNGPKWPDDTGKDSLEKTGTQTIHYEGAGNETPKDNVQTTTFTRTATVDDVTGKVISTTDWTPSEHTFGTVKTPVIKGYHANTAEAGGFKATPNDPTKTYNVTYSPNGKIVPVTPDGTPIPNVPNPPYTTNPDNPTGVTPNEPVPTIPGYTPQTPNVTPTNPGTDTKVVYTPTPTEGSLTITVHDQTTDTNLPQYGYNSGNKESGSKVTYDWNKVKTDLEDKGYQIVTPNVQIPSVIGKTAQTITIDVKHGTAPVGPNNPHEPGTPINPNDPNGPKWPAKDNYTKNYTSTVHFVDQDGKELAKPAVQTSTWTRTLTIDKVTGQILNPDTPWTSNKTDYANTPVPVIKGYVADPKSKDGYPVSNILPGRKVVQKDISDSVIYHQIGKIIPVTPSGNPIPGASTPQYQNDPNNPTKVVPNEPVPSVPGYTPSQNTITPTSPTKDTPVVYTPNNPNVPVTPDVTTIQAKQTIEFVDGDGVQLLPSNVQTHTFTLNNGVSTESSYTFGTIKVPVIKGYVANLEIAGGKTVTPQDPDAKVVVVYHKIGEIIPVTPDGNPIPGATTPQYQNDPNNPTKVLPNEPVPNVPGYTPSQNTVTPTSPTEDTKVVYNKTDNTVRPHPQVVPNNNKPKKNETVRPHPQVTPTKKQTKPQTPKVQPIHNGGTKIVLPHGQRITSEGLIVTPSGQVVGYVQNNEPHYIEGISSQTPIAEKKAANNELPQTGEKDDPTAAILGAAAASIGLIGLAGVKKRHKD
ncbi:mucin-binding protein [Lactobacillus intestinalis]|uniref:mucin-binding protein n=1 Tax=Lactobacillus intestinalis TaxID=151781 RepID=UPI0024943FC6|nr:YSIRK-type signal peptide-containing protein [Lactobacillus intestinalis]